MKYFWKVVQGAAVALAVACTSDQGDRSLQGSTYAVIEQVVDHELGLSLLETWRIGREGDPSGAGLYRVRGADIGSHGMVFVLDSGNDRVLAVDSMGTVVRQFGGAGAGPGEFGSARAIISRRDTVVVQDSNRRVHFFESDGTLIGTQLLQFEDPEVNHLSLIGSSSEDWFVSAAGYFRGGGVEEPPVQREHFFLVDPESGDLEATDLRWTQESIGVAHAGFFWLQPILVHRPSAALDGLGRFIVADTATYRLDLYGMDGELRSRIENEVVQRPLDDAVIDLWRESRDCPAGPEMAVECSREMDQKTLGLPRTEHRPVVSGLRAYATGHFSVLRGDLDPNPFDGESVAEYDYFDAAGAHLGSTSGLVPLAFDGRVLISLERDSMGVESVARYVVVDLSARTGQ